MLAYYDNPQLKEYYVNLARFHREAGQMAKGYYWWGDGTFTDVPGLGTVPNGRGCAIGCADHADHAGNHERLAHESGVPAWLLLLADGIFESLADGKFQVWPERFWAAIQTGADLELVWNRLAIYGCTLLRAEFPNNTEMLEAVIALHRRVLAGDEPAASAWHPARDAWTDWHFWPVLVARNPWVTWPTSEARDPWDAWATGDAEWSSLADKLIEFLEAGEPATA